jgi:maleate isomerase
MTRAVAAENPQAIMIVCTNLRAAPLVEQLEQETGIPIYDSLSAVVWRALRLAGVDTAPIKGWGRLFASTIL